MTLLTISFIFPFCLIAQSINFSLTIRFKRLASSGHVYILLNDEKRIVTLPFPPNDTLYFNGSISKPGTFQIGTDSSLSGPIWIDKGVTSFTLSEERTRMNKFVLRVSNLDGSDDSKLFLQMSQPKILTAELYSGAPGKDPRDSISQSLRLKFIAATYEFIDSLFTARPNSPIIPYYINFYQRELGPDTVAHFYYKLSRDLQASEPGSRVKEFLDRNILLSRGTTVENFSMKNQLGLEQSLYSVSAKYILVDFWASWCRPCRVDNRNLVGLYKKYKQKGLEIIGVSLDDDRGKWLAAIKDDKVNWYHVSELNRWENSIVKKYKISSIPFMFLLDANYKIVAANFHVGQLEQLLERLYN